MGMAGMAVVALIVGALIAWLMVDQAFSAQKVGGEAKERPALFLGNESLPPMNFMKQGKPTGIVVDLAKAVAERMHRPVEIQLMNWTEAQQLVLDGRAEALLQIDPNPERLKIYDFSDPLLNTEFTIFTSGQRLGVASIGDLRGLKVGVEEKGLPILLLQKDPQIIVKIFPDFVQGFRMLAAGALDAMVADRWVGSYVLAENNIRGVKLIEEPIGRSHSAIAVKKGNTNLLGDINAALADIRRNGTYDRIIKAWRSKEVVFKTRQQLRQQAWLIAAISVALIAALLSIAALVMEIRRRKRSETTLRESEARLRESQERLGLFIEYAPASLAMFDKDMRYLNVSRRWLSDYGLADRDILGLSHYEVFPEIPERWKEAHRRGLSGEVVRSEGDRFERSDESVQWLQWEVRPWYGAPGEVAGILIFTEDITARKHAEEALRERTTDLEYANRELEAFSYSVSHDLKAPIRAIEGFSRMLLGEHAAKLDAEGLRMLDIITSNTKRMAALIDDLLALSQLGWQQVRNSLNDLSTMIKRVFKLIHDAEPEREVQLTVQPDLPLAWGDPSLLYQVMMNLLGNALKYTKTQKTAIIEVGGYIQGSETIYFIKDNGIGFDARYADKLFGVFQRLHGGEEYEGTGVGLAIVQRIIHRHGGRVWAEGKVGEGATFYFALPKE